VHGDVARLCGKSEMIAGRRQRVDWWLPAVGIVLTVVAPASSLVNVYLGIRGLFVAVRLGGPFVPYMTAVVILAAVATALSFATGASLWMRRLPGFRLARTFTSVYVATLGAGVLVSAATGSIPQQLDCTISLSFAQELAREAMVGATLYFYLWRSKCVPADST